MDSMITAETQFDSLTKDDMVKFSNEKFKDNYVVVYKRTGENKLKVSVEKPKINPENPPAVQPNNPPRKAIFDGYVARSTDERTKLSNLAIQTWLRDPQTVLFGVGAGSAGRAIRQHTAQTGWDFEIVQNEFLANLCELGIVGFAIWVAIIAGFIWKTRAQKWLWVILLAFLIQWNFFSGLPNSLHIYLILAVIFATTERAYEEKSAINRRIHSAPKKDRN